MPDATALMDWAQTQYATFFPGPQQNRTAAPYVYRYYPSTGNYLGVDGLDIYILGPVSGGALLKVGTLADFATQVYPEQYPARDIDAVRLLHQAQFAATDEDVAAVRARGFGGWLHDQFTRAPGQSGAEWLDAGRFDVIDTATRYYFSQQIGDRVLWAQLFTRQDAVRTRVAFALSEHFVVAITGIDSVDSWFVNYGAAGYWDLLCSHAFGNFRQLLEAVTLSPAMGAYLGTLRNLKEDPATGRVPDENYAREVMQLFTIGLHELNPDGTEKLDAAGNRIETYDLDDVTGLARVFTGYDVDYRANQPTPVPTTISSFGVLNDTKCCRKPMYLSPSRHSFAATSFLNVSIPADTDGTVALKFALDTLFAHPNVGPFFGRRMIQRLVTGNPSTAYVQRVAAAFNDNGHGVRGDMQAMLTAILLDDEARDATRAAASGYGKLREPVVRFVQWAHTFSDVATRARWQGGNYSDATSLSQSPMRASSVFNFFRPGYVPPGTEMAHIGATAPEFQIVNESTTASYINFIQEYIQFGFWVPATDRVYDAAGNYVPPTGDNVRPTYARELALVDDPMALVRRLNLLLAAGRMSDDTVGLIADAISAIRGAPGDTVRMRDRIAAGITLVMASPEYLVQK